MRPKGINFIICLLVVYIYWGINYLIFGWFETIYPYIIFMQSFYIFSALNPAGEEIIKFIYNARRIVTEKDREYLYPIFDSVYNSVLHKKWWTSKRVELHIDRSMSVNAYALGANSIVITRGAINTLSEEQLKGVIAHEFGHLHRGDTMLPLILIGGNFIFVLAYVITKIMKAILRTSNELINADVEIHHNYYGKFIIWLFCLTITPLVILIQGLFALVKRENEYKADKFAFDVGYGENLISALYTLDKIDISSRINILQRLKMSHPYIDVRIKNLEDMKKEID